MKHLSELDHSKAANVPRSKAARLCRNLIEILAIADETCFGIGIPFGEYSSWSCWQKLAAFHLVWQFHNESPSTLCRYIKPELLSVLPKLHTPQSGITIRSLSHNLALCHGSEVKSHWLWGGSPYVDERHGLNILLLPWPVTVHPADFTSCEPRCGGLPDMDESQHGFFRYRLRGGRKWNPRRFREVIEKAKMHVGRIDAIVLPELAVTERELKTIATNLLKSGSSTDRDPPPMVIAGVAAPHSEDCIWNKSVTLIPSIAYGGRAGLEYGYARFEQPKHHRWKLDKQQIMQYGLGGFLDPAFTWWENSHVPNRELFFVSMNAWLTICTLLCEDLARPDPIADVIRAVGPNLIIALLLDGPQLAKRWPARYGTVLADDPGSSVLTVTNLGMAELSRPRGHDPLRVVALWKDSQCGEPIEIRLPPGKEGIVLCVTREFATEFTADGRTDGGNAAARLVLAGAHPV
jgi:hypothetical protein